MTVVIAELYEALLAAGSPKDKARAASRPRARCEEPLERFIRIETDLGELKRAVGEIRQRLSAVERDTHLLKWMVGCLLSMQVATLFKLVLD